MDREAAERRRARLATWKGERTIGFAPKGTLLDELSPEDRVRALAALNARVWANVPALPRSEWPAEVYELPRR
ncbi:MAG: hypothetical protein AAF645_07125 [Myxococcota bacterium]